jgi:hypothetical protein
MILFLFDKKKRKLKVFNVAENNGHDGDDEGEYDTDDSRLFFLGVQAAGKTREDRLPPAGGNECGCAEFRTGPRHLQRRGAQESLPPSGELREQPPKHHKGTL